MNRFWNHGLSITARYGAALLICAAIFAFGNGATAAYGQSHNTEHTLNLDDPSAQPPSTLEDVEWMVGSWEGEAFGGSFEEDWLPASGGTMTGVFKLMHEGSPSLYEFMMIVEKNGSLAVQLRHFNSDFTSWEDKSEFVSFPLVKLTEDAAYFDGMTYRRVDDDRLVAHVSIGEGDEKEEAELKFVRTATDGESPPRSPYTGLEARPIKALSGEQVESYLAGEGMGLAMAAELNGYPGPKHVLELQQELKLSPDQLEATRSVFERMHTAATALGGRIVAAEKTLDRLFAQHQISGETVATATGEIASLGGELRAVHLQAHLEMVEILSNEQRHEYMTHRGYGGAMPAGHHPRMHHVQGS